jgi:hypothetical protein
VNGPEHYKRAEELEQLAEEEWRRSNYGWAPVLIARAQVHATLACAAVLTGVVRDIVRDEIQEHAETAPHIYADGSSA